MRTDALHARLEGEKVQDDGREEHESDKEGRLEESNQVKHWVLDPLELSAPPKF